MTLILSGTDGLSDVDGTAATPALRGTDANTGIFFPAADTIAFAEGGAEAMRIDSSGNVGIGTTSPASKLDINTGGSTGTQDLITLSGLDNASTKQTYATLRMGIENSTAGSEQGNLHLQTVESGTVRDRILLNGTGYQAFSNGGTERMRIDSSGDVGIGTSNPETKLHVEGTVDTASSTLRITATGAASAGFACNSTGTTIGTDTGGILFKTGVTANTPNTTGSERARIASDGAFLIGKTTTDDTTQGFAYRTSGYVSIVRNGGAPLSINRRTDDGELVEFFQENVKEGTISVSGTTVSYNGGHLSRWAQTTAPKDDSLLKGTVLSNLDEMNVYTDADSNPIDNEQLNKVKVSDVEGDANVAGVFVNWTHDDAHNVDEINMAMTGDMIIRIAQGTTVARGDLLMSAGDGTAKPQGDDIVRSKTVAKVTSTHVTCTYADGSFCVPCVLMAC